MTVKTPKGTKTVRIADVMGKPLTELAKEFWKRLEEKEKKEKEERD
ncbi:hypothetical protein EYM_06100 [Ignicoccus islandicus DSM 13165]|uniref:Uncharacterized protein n=1 Tax=Ignicoccus islandicus DSM 13165 TaxID=940295 RepID=A0A0U2MBF2_9CREN|nr:hypothetical protein EYM_06100 [Ignicoccus islandicus DSM 13165]